jgi:hypothetical protein
MRPRLVLTVAASELYRDDARVRCRGAFASGSCQRAAPPRVARQGDGAPRSANPMVPHPFPDAAGASRRATCAQGASPRVGKRYRPKRANARAKQPHAYLQRPYGSRPRFSQPVAPAQRAMAHEQVSASSWQDLIVGPGGAPLPPECFIANEARGRRAPSRSRNASRERPLIRTR